MIEHKDLIQLEKNCIKNNGETVKVWDDEGIKVNKIRFKMKEYGNMEYNFKGNCYVTFESKEGEFITIEYNLLSNPKKPTTNDIFKFVLIRENY
jgi:hypothetical protein